MIRTIVIDDEPLARKGIIQLLEAQHDIRIIAQCEDGISALEHIEQLQPDLVFLDIQMPAMNGFEVIDHLQTAVMPLVIFVTAYDEFALQAFQAHAVDYLLKPVKEENFLKALQRARVLVQAKNNSNYLAQMQLLLEEVKQQAAFIDRFIVREKNRLLVVALDSVQIIKARNDYVELICQNENHLLRDSLTRLEKKLDPALFIRISRSLIVRISLIRNLKAVSKGDYTIQLSNNQTFRLSRTYREKVFASLKT